MTCRMASMRLSYTDEETKRTYLWPFFLNGNNQVRFGRKKEVSMVIFVIRYRVYSLESFILSNTLSTIAIH
jgi:hypothetical protein